MVDATGFDTTLVKCRCKADLDMIMERFDDGEGIELLKDLTFDYEFLEEGRSLSLIGKNAVKNKTEMWKEINENHELLPCGRYKPYIPFCFFAMKSVETACGNLVEHLAKSEKVKKDKEFKKEALEEAGILPDEEFGYLYKNREWVVPETKPEDDRRGENTRFVAGGTPQSLGQAEPPAVAASEPPIRKITKYATGEPDEKKRNQKIYIEQEEVVNADKGGIHVDFKQTSYSVKVNSSSATYVLGPIECGHIVPSDCSWRLSPGKRLTLTLMRSRPVDYQAAMKAHEKKGEQDNYMVYGMLIAVVIAFLTLALLGGTGKR